MSVKKEVKKSVQQVGMSGKNVSELEMEMMKMLRGAFGEKRTNWIRIEYIRWSRHVTFSTIP